MYKQYFVLNFVPNTNKIVNTQILITSIIIYIIESYFYQTTNSLCFVFMAFYYNTKIGFYLEVLDYEWQFLTLYDQFWIWRGRF